MALRRGYSQALAVTPASGQLVFVSGQIARSPDGKIIGPGDARRQARECFEQIASLLEDIGGSMRDVTRLGYYFTDIDEDLGKVIEVRDTYDWDAPPASTAVEVSRLVHPELRVEIEATAVIRQPAAPAAAVPGHRW